MKSKRQSIAGPKPKRHKKDDGDVKPEYDCTVEFVKTEDPSVAVEPILTPYDIKDELMPLRRSPQNMSCSSAGKDDSPVECGDSDHPSSMLITEEEAEKQGLGHVNGILKMTEVDVKQGDENVASGSYNTMEVLTPENASYELSKKEDVKCFSKEISDQQCETSKDVGDSENCLQFRDLNSTKSHKKFNSEILNSYKSEKWQPGDIVWAGLRSYPLWPSIIVHDKDSGSFLQTKAEKTSPTGKLQPPRKYYLVRFFGDNFSQGWVSSKFIFKFVSIDFFNMLQQAVKDHKTLRSEYGGFVKPLHSYKKKWSTALEEAHSLLPLEREERIIKFDSLMRTVSLQHASHGDSAKVKKVKLKTSCTPLETHADTATGASELELEPSHLILNALMQTDGEIESERFIDKLCQGYDQQKLSKYACDFEVSLDSVGFSAGEDPITVKEKPKVSPTPPEKLSSSKSDPNNSSSSSKSEARKLSLGKKKTEMICQDLGKKFLKSYTTGKKPCLICETYTPEVKKCSGKCRSPYHPSCCAMEASVEEFTCPSCSGSNIVCFVCKNCEGTLLKCNEPSCVKVYHEECLKLFPQAYIYSDAVSCPLHLCHTCASENPKDSSLRVRTTNLVKCLRCPSAYHPSDRCIPAGTHVLSGGFIICPKHFTPKGQISCSVGWCFICSIGGSLICCETCPASFHVECLNIQAPEGSFYCEDCESGRLPLYGDIVWAKCGNFRWWPAEIIHPRNIPTNVADLSHDPHQFCIQFFGSYDFCWSDREKVFRFETGDSSENKLYKRTSVQYQKAVDEAGIAHAILKQREALEDIVPLANEKPPRYTKIRTNRPIDVVTPELDLSQLTQCECNPLMEHPCGTDSNCLNRIMMIECHPGICHAKDRCENQRFKKCQYPLLDTMKVPGRGWGLKTLQDLKKGEFVCEYVGELISSEECHRRIKHKQKYSDENHYFLTLDKDRIIDAGPKGNLSRFMNHSCAPNCESQKWTVNSDNRVGLFALQDIPAGSELTFDYKLEAVGSSKKKCECGAEKCSGFIGEKVKPTETIKVKRDVKDGKDAKVKMKKKGNVIKFSEQECSICWSPGTLVACKVRDCSKVYHPSCISEDLDALKKDLSKWACPYHFCNVCGIESTSFCWVCPSSYCQSHNEVLQHNLCPGHPSSGMAKICDMIKIYNLGKDYTGP